MTLKHIVRDDYLGGDEAHRLLSVALANEDQFEAAQVYRQSGREVDHGTRRASQLMQPGTDTLDQLKARLEADFGSLCEMLGIAAFALDHIELDMAVHRDGDFFRSHVDTITGGIRTQTDRVISAVYYFHRLPRAFTGGELGLHSPTGELEATVDPSYDRLVAFPSFQPHEVFETHVPGNGFGDARFSVNCWFHRARA